MNEYTDKLTHYLHALSLRERILVLAVACSVIYLFTDTAVLSQHHKQSQALSQQQVAIQQQQQQLNAEIEKSARELAQKETAIKSTKQRIAKTALLLEETNANLDAKLNKLVPPTKITELLRSFLASTSNLKILALNNEPVKVITLDVTKGTSQKQDHITLYEHATLIQLSGQYQQLYNYLKALENSHWQLFWDNLQYQVTDYPNAQITLRVHTISTNEHWIGL